MTLGQIQREFAAGRLTPEQAAELSMNRSRPSAGAWRGLVLMAAVVGTAVALLLLAGKIR